MKQGNEEPRVDEIDLLRPPPRSEAARRLSRDRILALAARRLAERRLGPSSWDILVQWARPGLAAAAIGFALLVGALRMADPAPAQIVLDDLFRSGAAEAGLPAWLIDPAEPNEVAMLEAALLPPNPNGGEQR